MAYAWFFFKGGDLNNPLNYTFVKGLDFKSKDEVVCAIYAKVQYIDFIPRPILTIALLHAINTAVITGEETYEIKLVD